MLAMWVPLSDSWWVARADCPAHGREVSRAITTPIVSSRLAYSRCSPVAIARATSGPRAAS